MAKRKELTLKELYNDTKIITELKITPVLGGSCRMQGPIEDTEYGIQSNTVSSQVDKGFIRHSKSQKVHVRAESGMCNLCSATCSACLHINQVLMGSKTDESSDETCRENTFSYSVNDVVPTVNSRTCEMGQHTASETSNLVSVNSSHDSFFQNAENQSSLRASDVFVASEDVEISPKFSSGGTVREDHHISRPQFDSDKINLANKFEDPRGLEGNDDNILCISRANDADKFSLSYIGNIERNLPCSSAPANSLVSEGYGKTVSLQTASACLDIKCDIEGSQNNSNSQSRYNKKFIQKVHPHISLSTDLSSHNCGSMENSSSKDTDDGAGSRNVKSTFSHPPSGKTLSCNPRLRDLEEDSCSRLQGELPECSREHLKSLMTKEVASDIVCRQKSASYNYNDTQNSKVGLVGGNSKASVKNCQKLEAEIDIDGGDIPAGALDSVEQNQEVEEVKESLVLPDVKGPSFQSQSVDEGDGSDIVEHDVKVCDICGDAGWEDFLAICCRCSDGAEHTYCMREMLNKVPEGDWLCEECKSDEEIKNQKQDEFGTVSGVEKNQSSGHAGTENANLCVKSDAKGSDVEGNRTNKDCSSAEVSCKRNAEHPEVFSAAKKQALKPIVGSLKASSPNRIAALSRDISFKNFDRAKVMPCHQFPSRNRSVSDTLENSWSPSKGPRLQTPQGAFLKSNSFSFSNAKLKVKLLDEVFPEKQKLIRVPTSLDTKKGTVKVIGKSMSFKSANSGQLNACESKVKVLSPKFSHVQNLKVLKHTKDRNLFERKNSIKSERPSINSTVASSTVSILKVDQKLGFHGETVSLSSTINCHEVKVVQSDSQSIMLSKPSSHLVHRGSEMPVPSGEVKKPLSCLLSVVGASSADGISSSLEQKPIQTSVKNGSSSNSFTEGRPLWNVNENLQDGLPWPREATNLAERVKESSISCPRQSIATDGRSDPCPKCNEIGHSAQLCTGDSPWSLAIDPSGARSFRELKNKGNKLKAAIEAAMLIKPGIYRKNRVLDQSDELSVSSINCEVASQYQLSSSSNTRNMASADEVNDGEAALWYSNADSSKQLTGSNVKQLMVLPAEAVTSRRGDSSPISCSDGKPFMMDLASHASEAMSVLLKMSALPEHLYTWQGIFEVHRNGKIPDLYDGFQAHLSTCASPRVLEAVNKFPLKVLLTEVPRLSTWPIQFEESVVKEDNIALYFFAKDLESYEKSYKILLEILMRSDLALKGNIDGVELLIFPSNQLPDKSQRWNMLFFLWGVFREKRLNCLQQVPCSPKKFFIPRDIPTAIMSLPENICSLRPIDRDTCDRTYDVASEAPALMDLGCLSLTETMNGDCDTKISSLLPKDKFATMNVELLDCRPDSNSLTTIQTSSAQSWPQMRCTGTSLGCHVGFDYKLDAELQVSVQATRTVSGSNRSEKMPSYWDTPLDRHWASTHYVNKVPVDAQVLASARNISEEKIPDRMTSSKDQVQIMRNFQVEGSLDSETSLETKTMTRIQNTKELNNFHFNRRKCSSVDPTEMLSQAAFAVTSQTTPWNEVNSTLVDGVSASKKQTSDFSGLYGCNCYTFSSGDDLASRIHNVASCSPIKENLCDEMAILENSGNGERYFFPVDRRPVKDIGLGINSMPGTVFLSDNVDRLLDRAPNLELALGAETKPTKQGIPPFLVGRVDKRINQHQPPNEAATKEEEDELSASLSLSLSFPVPDKDRSVQSVTKAEQGQLLPGRRHVNSSLLLFGSFSDT